MDASELLRIAKEGAELAEKASPGPWTYETGKVSGRNWLLGSSSEDGKDYSVHITTDGIHCSEMYGDAKTDAMFIAHAGTHYGDICEALVRELEGEK